MFRLHMTGCDNHVLAITFALEHVTLHILKYRHEASTTRHEVRSYNVTSQNHVTVTLKFLHA